MDGSRTARTGFLQLLFPPAFDSSALERLSRATADCGAYWSGVAGYVTGWSMERKAATAWPARAWCRRYLGLDVQDPDAMAWRARLGLPGTNWLTLVGDGLAAAHSFSRENLLARGWRHGIQAQPVHGGVLIRAGTSPDLGDLNALSYPYAYSDVARSMQQIFVTDPPQLWGGHGSDAVRWLRRFIDPAGWD